MRLQEPHFHNTPTTFHHPHDEGLTTYTHFRRIRSKSKQNTHTESSEIDTISAQYGQKCPSRPRNWEDLDVCTFRQKNMRIYSTGSQVTWVLYTRCNMQYLFRYNVTINSQQVLSLKTDHQPCLFHYNVTINYQQFMSPETDHQPPCLFRFNVTINYKQVMSLEIDHKPCLFHYNVYTTNTINSQHCQTTQ